MVCIIPVSKYMYIYQKFGLEHQYSIYLLSNLSVFITYKQTYMYLMTRTIFVGSLELNLINYFKIRFHMYR